MGNKNVELSKIPSILYTKNKYLDEIGAKEYFTNFFTSKKDIKREMAEDGRAKKWQKERDEYGFDSRETWNLDSTMIEWIYTRFKMYKEVCNVDLDVEYIKFPYTDAEGIRDLSQADAIDLILDRCEKYIKADFQEAKDMYSELFDDNFWKLFGELLPAMWW